MTLLSLETISADQVAMSSRWLRRIAYSCSHRTRSEEFSAAARTWGCHVMHTRGAIDPISPIYRPTSSGAVVRSEQEFASRVRVDEYCYARSRGWQIIPEVAPVDGETIVAKRGKDPLLPCPRLIIFTRTHSPRGDEERIDQAPELG